MKILIIDDDERLRRVIGKMLRGAGHQVIGASNGRHGMAAFLKERPPIVVTDIIMPEQEGIETIVALRRHDPAIKIIAISGGGWAAGGLNVLKMAQMLGADDVIEKPFSAKQLLGSVETVAAGLTTMLDAAN